jgi:carboxypeptidase Taq
MDKLESCWYARNMCSTPIEKLNARLAEIDALNAAMGIMGWDQQTYMPQGGARARAQHLGLLSRMSHDLFIQDETQRLVEESMKTVEPGTDNAALLRVVKRGLDLATKLPSKLVEEKAKLSAEGLEAWVKARTESNYEIFRPILERLVEITKEEAGYFGYKDHIYDALIDLYEEGATTADCVAMYDAIKTGTVPLVKDIAACGRQEDDKALYGKWDAPKQHMLTLLLVAAIGFDLKRGRQDTSEHPFTTGWSVGDTRITTRFMDYLPSAIFSSLHEAGHGMYEQNSPEEWDLTPLCGGVSMAFHESQSRTWENIVGRSRAFWSRFLPDLHSIFPETSAISLDSWYRMINRVEPSLIRVEADEVTYNLHTLVRFEIECDLMTDKLAVKDIPEVWNAKYEAYLGIRPKNDAEGCLQDMHWSGGSIGYFPTYSMGNMLSFQIWTTLTKDLGDPDALIAKGEFEPILGWLKEKIYSKGCRYTPKELVLQVTGKPLGAEDYVAGLNKKYRAIYGV